VRTHNLNILAAAAVLLATQARAQTDAEIRQLLVDRIDVQHKSVGTVAGIATPQGRRFISYGQADRSGGRPLDGDTVFEIGSMTKVFTALLLADAVQRGEVALSDPVAKYLPAGVKVPERNGRQITLVDLATHTSGLPFLPSNMGVDLAAVAKYSKEQLRQAFSTYTDEKLYQFLATYELPRDIGSQWNYSNLGMGLVGKALARRAGMDYESLVRLRITGPLGMKSTAIAVSPEMKARLATGHEADLKPAPDWALPALEGAGSLHSSANDLLTLAEAFMGYRKTPLAPAMAAMLETRRPGPGLKQALGWWVISFGPGDDGIVTFAGETFGYACTLGYDPKLRIGVVALSNTAQNDGGLAWHILRPAFPVATSAAAKAIKERKEITLDSKLLDLYAGPYQTPPPGGVITIERQGDALVLKSDAAPQGLRLHAESERKFFITETDLQVTFETDSQGRATRIVVRFGGTDTAAARIEAGGGKP
jgi:CubicO group peptidase (beta-lactamase class C family)